MLADFVRSIVDLGKRSQVPAIIRDYNRGMGLVCFDGTYKEFALMPSPRTALLNSIDAFIACVNDPCICPAPEVYHDHASLRVVTNRNVRDEVLRMPLDQSARYASALRLHYGAGFSPKDAIRLLRTEFGDAAPSHVVTALRNIDFTRTSSGKSVVEHGRESLGRSVEAAVQQADRIPEGFTLRLPVYTNPGVASMMVDLQVGLAMDLEQQFVRFFIMPDEDQAAIGTVQAMILSVLEEHCAGVPILAGCP